MDRRVGEVAQAAGVTVRALHHYEDIGLLVPSGRDHNGHRRYDDDDLRRLLQIRLLRELGMGLHDVASILTSSERFKPLLETHLASVDAAIERLARRRSRLAALVVPTTTASRDLLALAKELAMSTPTMHRRITYLAYQEPVERQAELHDVFGLQSGAVHRDGDGDVALAIVHAGDGEIWLHPERDGLVSPRTLGSATAGVAIHVDDVDAHHRAAVARGAHVLYEPTDMEYGLREWGARDAEGGLWAFQEPLG